MNQYLPGLVSKGYQDLESLKMCYSEFKQDDKLMQTETGINSLIHRKMLLKLIATELIIDKKLADEDEEESRLIIITNR